jgi:GTP-binding protein
LFEGARIVDCPGYGFASVDHTEKENWRKFMEMYLRDAESLHRIIMLIDMTAGIQNTDQSLIDILIDKQTPINIVMTKSDKLPSKFLEQKTRETIDVLRNKGLL